MTWTDDELIVLVENFTKSTDDKMKLLIPTRSLLGIWAKARRLGLIRGYKESTYSDLPKNISEIVAWSISWEGAIMLRKSGNYLQPVVTIGNTNHSLIKKFRELIGIGYIVGPYGGHGNRRTSVRWGVGAIKDVKYILNQILEYLPSKRGQAILLLEYCNIRIENWRGPRTEREYEIHEIIKKLNKRGND